MKKVLPPLVAYLVVCLIAIFLPAADGYNTIGWKLFIGQAYAIPVLLVVILVTYFVNNRQSAR